MTVITLPITNPTLIFALAMAIFLISPLLADRLRLPGIVGLILAGAVVGPNALNILARDTTFVLLGTVGLLYLVFLAAAEIDLYGFIRNRRRALEFGFISFIVPLLAGIAVGLLLGYSLAAALLLGSIFGSHTLVAYPVAARLGLVKTRAAMTAVGGTIVTDSSAFLVLAVVAAWTVGVVTGAFWLRLTISLAVFVFLVMVVLPKLARWFFRNEVGGATAEYIFVLAAVFAGAFVAQLSGLQPIVGAFLVGLALNPLIPGQGPLISRLHFFGNALFIPFFLVSVGMLLDPLALLGGLRVWTVILAMVGTVTATKWLAARLAQNHFGYSRTEGLLMFGLSVPQAAATLAVTLIGYEIGLLDDAVLNGAVVMILVTCLVGPWTVQKYGQRLAMEQQPPDEALQGPQRILVPMAKPTTAEALLDLAITVRDPRSRDPVYTLTVVPPTARGVTDQIAEAEQILGHAVLHFASADVPARAITRVDPNPTSGILRAIVELSITTVIIGWHGSRPGRHRTFGSVFDQLLAESQQLLLVTKLGHPLKVSKRFVVILPPGSDKHPGFSEAAATVKLLAHRLGASLLLLEVGSSEGSFIDRFRAIRPAVRMDLHSVSRWNLLLQQLRAELRADDVVIVFGARRGTVAWHPKLDRLPSQLAELRPESFIILYPGQRDLPGAGTLVGSAANVERQTYGQLR